LALARRILELVFVCVAAALCWGIFFKP